MPVFDEVPPGNFTFSCIDGHTCGNPVRLVFGGVPQLDGATMSARRQDFLARFDWIRKALMFEPRGHDVMSGSMLYPATRPDCDIGILFIEVSGCLPMCGHGTIGTVTLALEHGLVVPRTEGILNLDTPAGLVSASFVRQGPWIDSVRIRNVPSYLAASDLRIEVPELGELVVDVAYGGNYYAIIEPQPHYRGIDELGVDGIRRLSPLVRNAVRARLQPRHPVDPTIGGVSHVMWTDAPRDPRAHARNAVFYGDQAIDRSPCGTGTSARMAQRVAHGALRIGDDFIHESIIGTLFEGRVEAATTLGDHAAVIPSISGWARMHGLNTLFVNNRDPLRGGFQLS
ncbi:MAG: 4-hydroxyproline epimerase [Azospirillaceae bacterium]|nr:4-hydroxyproline epimerase [Azospirillaceae bacterium]